MKQKHGFSRLKAARMTGFFHRSSTAGGRKVLNRRRAKGRMQICGPYS